MVVATHYSHLKTLHSLLSHSSGHAQWANTELASAMLMAIRCHIGPDGMVWYLSSLFTVKRTILCLPVEAIMLSLCPAVPMSVPCQHRLVSVQCQHRLVCMVGGGGRGESLTHMLPWKHHMTMGGLKLSSYISVAVFTPCM